MSYPITIKTHWFPGVLRIFVDLGQPPRRRTAQCASIFCSKCTPTATIPFASPIPATNPHSLLPFDKWNDGIRRLRVQLRGLPRRTVLLARPASEGTVKFGARDCDVVKSTPGSADKAHYAEVNTWIDPAIGFPVYVEKTLKGTPRSVKEFTSFGLRQRRGRLVRAPGRSEKSRPAGLNAAYYRPGSAKANLTAADFSPAAAHTLSRRLMHSRPLDRSPFAAVVLVGRIALSVASAPAATGAVYALRGAG